MEDAAQDVGVRQRAAWPLERKQLEIAADDVGKERGELVGVHLESAADPREILLNHRRL